MINVSIIMPVKYFNQYMEESIQTTLDAMHPGMELIIVDDDSDLEAKKTIIKGIRQKRNDVKYIPSSGKGIVDALLTGLKVAEGHYIARMDADDLCMTDRFVSQVAYLNNHPDVGLVSCRVKYGGNPVENAGFARFVDWLNDLNTHDKMYAKRYAEVVVAHPSVIFRRELLSSATYRSENKNGEVVPEDFDLWLRWLNMGVKFAKLDECHLIWTDLPNRLSRTDMTYDKKSFWNSVAENFRLDPSKEVWICGYGRPVEKRLKALKKNGMRVSGYIALEQVKRADGIPVITLDNCHELKKKAIILIFVANYEGKSHIQMYLDASGFVETADYLWMI